MAVGRMSIVLLALLVIALIAPLARAAGRRDASAVSNAWLRLTAHHVLDLGLTGSPALSVRAEGPTVWVGAPRSASALGVTSRDGGQSFGAVREPAPPGLESGFRMSSPADADGGLWAAAWPHIPWRHWTYRWPELGRDATPLVAFDPFGSALVLGLERRRSGAAIVLRRFLPTAHTDEPSMGFGLPLELPVSDAGATAAAAMSGDALVVAWSDGGRAHVVRVAITEALCVSPRFALAPVPEPARVER